MNDATTLTTASRVDALHTDEGCRGLAETIEIHHLIGREFLAWLWFESEILEQKLLVTDESGSEIAITLWLEKRIELVGLSADGVNRSVLSGSEPTSLEDARVGLRLGKLPRRAAFCLGIEVDGDERQFKGTIDGDTLSLSGVRLPALLRGQGDDPIYERFTLLATLERMIALIFRRFLYVRTEKWDLTRAAMREWLEGSDSAEGKLGAYRASWQP